MSKLFKKKSEIFPEALAASNWWASKLLEPNIKFYNGPICLSIPKKSIPSKECVAVFERNLTEVINNCLKKNLESFPYELCISSSNDDLIKLAAEANIEDFESHFGKGALMFIDDKSVSVKESGRKMIKIRK